MPRVLTGPAGLVLALLVTSALLAGLWFGLLRGQSNSIEDDRRAIAAAKAETAEDRGRIDQISETGRDYLGELYTRNQAVDRLLPSSVAVGPIATNYPPQLNALGLTVIKFDPLDVTKSYQPFTVEAQGSYAAITSWLASLETAQQLTTVGSFQIEQPTVCTATSAGSDCAAPGTYKTTLELRFWTSPEEQLRPVTSGPAVSSVIQPTQ